jgi:cation diffusion facilitator family transporter
MASHGHGHGEHGHGHGHGHGEHGHGDHGHGHGHGEHEDHGHGHGASAPSDASHDAAHTVANERRTRIVLVLTVLTMIAELVVGLYTGSLALQADGWHMATHAGALGLATFGYWYARTHADDASLAFGTGKVNALSGFASAVALGVVAVFMTIEAVERLVAPEPIEFGSALPVAVLGLGVNLASLFLLGGGLGHGHGHGHGHEHGHGHGSESGQHDHNLRGVYLHVLADVITSVLAIAALVLGAWLAIAWLDAVTALVASVLIVVWARQLLRDTARPLLDARAPSEEIASIEKELLGIEGVSKVSVCMWELGSDRRAVNVELTSRRPLSPRAVRAAVPELARFHRTAIEIHTEHADPETGE